MSKSLKTIAIPDEVVMSKIYLVRNIKVMLDRDLAELYGVETKVLKQAVKRNINRFPSDFMFEMSPKEFQEWRNEFATTPGDKRGLRYAPFCFTEQGVTMLSCVLNSQRAIELNIQIVRIFTKIREVLTDNLSVKLEIEEIKKKLQNQDKNIELVFNYLDELIEKQENPKPRKQIGYKRKSEE
jgi:phage regulator Rha-like protein